MNKILNIFLSLPKLMRLGVSLAVSFSAATGYIVATEYFDIEVVYVSLGVFLLAGGASALNQYQERETDSIMSRTKTRPIPSKTITVKAGLFVSILLCLLGFLILVFKAGDVPALLGLLNLVWYNGFYTYLKKKTAFAVVPGSLTGVTPILIGWTAAGLNLLSPTIILISFFIYMWQIPHFWLLLIKYAEDYEKAGLGTLHKLLSNNQIKRIIFSWIIATSLTSLLLPYFNVIKFQFLGLLLIAANLWLDISFYRIIFKKKEIFNYKKAFIEINAFMILVMSILIFDYLL